MSTNVIIMSRKQIVLATDLRSTNIFHAKIDEENSFEGKIFFNNISKLFIFNPPHNFVAVSSTGLGSINGQSFPYLLKKFETTLPNKRLLVKEFAVRLSNFLVEEFNTSPNDKILNSTINQVIFKVVGFDALRDTGLMYDLTIPNKSKPVEFAKGNLGVFVSGDGENAEQGMETFRKEYQAKIERKIQVTEKLGLPSSKTDIQILESLNNGEVPIHLMKTDELALYAKSIVDFLSDTYSNYQSPDIGGGIRMIALTTKDGVKMIQDDYLTNKNNIIAPINKHHFLAECSCGKKTTVQIDFEHDVKLNEGCIRYPADEVFRCSGCDFTINISNARKWIQENVSKKDIVF